MSEVLQIISTLGFPIFTALVCFWFIKYTIDQHREELKRLTETHKTEIDTLTAKHETESASWVQALNNNTLVMQQILDELRRGNDEKRTD